MVCVFSDRNVRKFISAALFAFSFFAIAFSIQGAYRNHLAYSCAKSLAIDDRVFNAWLFGVKDGYITGDSQSGVAVFVASSGDKHILLAAASEHPWIQMRMQMYLSELQSKDPFTAAPCFVLPLTVQQAMSKDYLIRNIDYLMVQPEIIDGYISERRSIYMNIRVIALDE